MFMFTLHATATHRIPIQISAIQARDNEDEMWCSCSQYVHGVSGLRLMIFIFSISISLAKIRF